MILLVNAARYVRKKWHHIFTISSRKTDTQEKLPVLVKEASIILIANPDKGTAKKENKKPVFCGM